MKLKVRGLQKPLGLILWWLWMSGLCLELHLYRYLMEQVLSSSTMSISYDPQHQTLLMSHLCDLIKCAVAIALNSLLSNLRILILNCHVCQNEPGDPLVGWRMPDIIITTQGAAAQCLFLMWWWWKFDMDFASMWFSLTGAKCAL